LVDAKRGQTVVDFCAGAGGKTLAMAAAMRDSGQIYAVDISSARLARLRPRLVRAGVSNIQPFAIDDEADPKLKRLGGRADRVLVDAPCSGTGTLRRNPDIKWRQSEASVRELVAKQGRILRAAAKLLKPGGRLVYATCSLLKAENEGVVSAFLAEHPNFALDNSLAFERPETRGAMEHLGVTPETVPDILRLAPHRIDADGFAAAILIRRV
jgi:16S rRNA (cytosine967-C5)-methyltransferase